MSLIPGSRFTIRSRVSPEEALSRLGQATSKPGWFARHGERRFAGEVANGAFRVMRVTRGQTAYWLVYQGTIAPAPGGSEVKVTTRLHTSAIVFFAIVITVLSAVGLPALASGLTSGRLDSSVPAIGGVIVFVLVVLRFAFPMQGRGALTDLAMIMAGDLHEG